MVQMGQKKEERCRIDLTDLWVIYKENNPEHSQELFRASVRNFLKNKFVGDKIENQ